MCEGECFKLLFRCYIYFLNFVFKQESFLLRKKQLLLLNVVLSSFSIVLLDRLNSIAKFLED